MPSFQVVISVAQHAVGALPFCAPVAAIIGGIYARATQVWIVEPYLNKALSLKHPG